MVVRLRNLWVGCSDTAIHSEFSSGTSRKDHQGSDQPDSREVFRGFAGGYRKDAEGWSLLAAYCGGPTEAPKDQAEDPWAQNARLVPEDQVQGVQDWKAEQRPQSQGEGSESPRLADGQKARTGEGGVPEAAREVQDDVAVDLVYEDQERVSLEFQSSEFEYEYSKNANESEPGRRPKDAQWRHGPRYEAAPQSRNHWVV